MSRSAAPDVRTPWRLRFRTFREGHAPAARARLPWLRGPYRGAAYPAAVRFLVARNPEPGSHLPYLLRLPIDGGLVLKARETWPRTARVYCHVTAWPEHPEVLEDVPVRLCVRRGPAIDLVLERSRENRCQFVFTELAGGRQAIFWQTQKVVRTARPGARIPGRRASGIAELEILVDTREQYPYRFARQQATPIRFALTAGDYAIRTPGGTILAAVERKSIADLASSLDGGTLAFELTRLAELPRAAVVVEDRYSGLLRHPNTPAGYLPDMLARVQIRYPEVPIVFAETRPIAEEWTYRYLAAALAETFPARSEPVHAPSLGLAGLGPAAPAQSGRASRTSASRRTR